MRNLGASSLRFLRKQPTVLRMAHPGSAIRAMRQAQDLSLRELARMSGTSPAYLSLVERGIRDNPSPRWLRAVTEALGKHMAGAA